MHRPALFARSTTRLGRLISIPAAVVAVGALVLGAGAATAAASPKVVGASYYVNCAAKANGSGSAASPWNSTKSVTKHGGYSAGDHILFKRATTCSGRLDLSGSGVSGSPIVLGAYGSGAKPTIKGGGTPNNTGTVQLTNVHDWTVQDLHLTNTTKAKAPTTYRSGLLLLNAGVGFLGGMTVQRLTVTGISSNPAHGNSRAYGGISALTYGKKGSGYVGLKIRNNTVDHVGRTGIIVSNGEYPAGADRNVRISSNKVTWSRGDSIVILGSKGSRIDHNLSAHGADLWPCPQCKKVTPDTADAGIWTAQSTSVRIDHNEVYGEHRLGGDGEGIDVDQSAVKATLEANYVHDNQGGGVLICGAKDSSIRYNIFENNARAAVVFTCKNPTKNVRIYNNTIYVAPSVSADSVVRTKQGFGAKGTQFVNNIVYSFGNSSYRFPGAVTIKANTFIGHHSKTEPKGSGTSHSYPGLRNPGTGGNGIKTLNGYKLQSVKAAQRGVATPASATTDFFGKKVNAKHPLRGASAG